MTDKSIITLKVPQYINVSEGESKQIPIVIHCPPELYGIYNLYIYSKANPTDTFDTTPLVLPSYISLDPNKQVAKKQVKLTQPNTTVYLYLNNVSAMINNEVITDYNFIVQIDEDYGDWKPIYLHISVPEKEVIPKAVIIYDNAQKKTLAYGIAKVEPVEPGKLTKVIIKGITDNFQFGLPETVQKLVEKGIIKPWW